VIAQYEGPLFTPTGVRRDSPVVQAGKVLFLGPPMGDLPVTGILRYELEDSVRARFNKYYKEHSVRVTPLIRLSISGAAKNPGFYQFRADVPLSDVIMRGGGQSTAGTIDDIVIKRGDKVIWGAQDVQSALTSGMTVSQLDLQAGDDIVVGQAAANNIWRTILPYATPIISGLVLLFFQRRR
jgi:protein involved in polysaccharide export with SLBB domain